MNLIEGNIIINILAFVLLLYVPMGSFMKDFSFSLRKHDLILMSSFMRHSRTLEKFWQRRKKWEVD